MSACRIHVFRSICKLICRPSDKDMNLTNFLVISKESKIVLKESLSKFSNVSKNNKQSFFKNVVEVQLIYNIV